MNLLQAEGPAELLVGPHPLGRDEARARVRRIGAWWRQVLPPGTTVAVATVREDHAALLLLAGLAYGYPILLLDPASPETSALAAAGAAVTDPDLGWPLPPLAWEVRPPPSDGIWARLTGRRQAPDPRHYPACLPVGDAEPAALPDELPEKLPDELPALLLPTGGTTGGPRIVVHTQGTLRAQMVTLRAALRLGPSARVLNLLPLHHYDGAVMGLCAVVAAGGVLVRGDSLRITSLPDVLDTAYRERITHLVAVPTSLTLLLRLGEDLRASLTPGTLVVSTAAALPDTTWRGLVEQAGAQVVNVYGLTETGNLWFAGPDAASGGPGTIGRPRDCEARIVEGELWIRGPSVSPGYLGAPRTDPWFPTGDLVEVEPDGLYRLVGRRKRMVKVGGRLVQPEEVEAALLRLPGVRDAAVWAVEDAVAGERLLAAVAAGPAAGATTGDLPDGAALADALRRVLAEHKVPREIRVLAALPRSAQGKLALDRLGGLASPSDGGDVLQCAARAFRVPVASLSLASTPLDVPAWDSLAHLDLVAQLEAAFGLTLSTRQVLGIRSLGDAARLLERLRS